MKILIFGDNDIGNYLMNNLKNYLDVILYNDENDLLNNKFDIIFCCDFINKNICRHEIYNLQSTLIHLTYSKIILLSSTLIYDQSVLDHDENSDLLSLDNTYSKNLFIIEQWIILNFNDYHIIRLPYIFCINIVEENFIYDLLNKEYSNINPYDIYSWYCIDDLLFDIKYIIIRKIKLVNLISESITTFSIISSCFDFDIVKRFLEYNPINTIKIRYNSIYIKPKSKLHILNKMMDFFTFFR